jgi:CRP-like cAMP-binding protein
MGNDRLKMLNLEQDSLNASGILGNASFFSGLNLQQIEAIGKIGRIEKYSEKSHLYELGELATNLYVLGQGAVRFAIGKADYQTCAGRIIWPGEVFGWASLVEQSSRRIATATCLSNSIVLAVDGTQLMQLMDMDHQMGYLLMKHLNSLITSSLTAFAAG